MGGAACRISRLGDVGYRLELSTYCRPAVRLQPIAARAARTVTFAGILDARAVRTEGIRRRPPTSKIAEGADTRSAN